MVKNSHFFLNTNGSLIQAVVQPDKEPLNPIGLKLIPDEMIVIFNLT
jgi:hypothetical protein